MVLKVDTLRIRYEPGQPIDPGFAQRVAELTGGQTLEDLYQAQLAQEAAVPPRTSWLGGLLQRLPWLKLHRGEKQAAQGEGQ